MKHVLAALATTTGLAVGGVALAHHSGAMFDRTRVVVISGTIKSFSYQAPHSWISILAAQPGKPPQQWDLELGAPMLLTRMGIDRDTLKPGEQVTAGLYPLHDGRAAGAFLYITDPAGKTYGVRPEDAKPAVAAP